MPPSPDPCGALSPSVAQFSAQMLSLLAERKRRLDLLFTIIIHPTSSLKLKLYALKSIGKIPYFRFRKREHTDPNLAGYRPQLKAFNRELLSTYINAQQQMTDLLESGKLTGKDFLLALGELAKLSAPNIRIEDHCDDPLPSHSKPPAESASQAAELEPNPRAAPRELEPTDLPASEIVQIVQNVQTTHNTSLTSNAATEPDLALAAY